MQNPKLAKSVLPFAVGAAVEIAGKVQKVVKRDGQCKLVIEPGNAPGFIVFADCISEAAAVTARKIRKSSLVSVRGLFASYGSRAVCLSDCHLQSGISDIFRQKVEKKQRNIEPEKT